jgi:hypothetical protein
MKKIRQIDRTEIGGKENTFAQHKAFTYSIPPSPTTKTGPPLSTRYIYMDYHNYRENNTYIYNLHNINYVNTLQCLHNIFVAFSALIYGINIYISSIHEII